MDLTRRCSNPAPPILRAVRTHNQIRQRPSSRGTPSPDTASTAKRLTDEYAAHAASSYASGESLRSIASRLQVSRARLSKLLQQNGVRLRPRGPSETQVREMRDRYFRGESLAQIGSTLGFDAKTVRLHLLRSGTATRDTHGRER
ncbi:helix-turn-helix domain-containing protein [Microlunatus sp. GCM10028923]|uniref:helix-turn-helix domain-containing protein n=1 Tax=Microlunatus sp. GCM10028923 TaxID=3273400 RepID=UPI00361D6420